MRYKITPEYNTTHNIATDMVDNFYDILKSDDDSYKTNIEKAAKCAFICVETIGANAPKEDAPIWREARTLIKKRFKL